MSKIFDLINELCPDGVEFMELGEVADIEKGKQLNKSLLSKNGKYPVMNGGINPSGYWHEYSHEADTTVISQGGASAGYVNWMNTSFFAGAHAFVITAKEKYVLKRYVYHYLKKNQQNFMQSQYGAGIPALAKSELEAFRFPVPPLEVQREIVRILDCFTLLTAELTAELTARKKQYEFYRDFLLSFDELNKNGGGCELRMLDEILDYTQPTNFIVDDTRYDDKVGIPVLTAGKSFILGYTNEAFGIYKASEVPAMIFDDFTTAFQWVDFDFKVKSSAIKILSNKDNKATDFKFVYYAMRCIKFEPTNHERHWISKYSKIKIPVPQIEVQHEIVRILDKFDTLINSITDGLPHEIELRRKQYEYYREKLLNFTEIEKEI
ncbi:restriction endonuclease subunit S [Campylobacter showae]|uniref:Type I restriction-modification system, specificity subunit S n=1 Tax=Campylobacter showae CSUNSWCD TaxID=1244083 RepID=M5IQ94_9BACT|nr:restriction endonuclease subunit S [Campylobacter showae]EKU10433.1 Type I restriction-modification system, specificity subunit S [Campylobacter showae CSUNSWCD]